jgi:hypothetical protein
MSTGNIKRAKPLHNLDDLASLPRWVAWHEETRGGKPTKIPVDPHSGRHARVPTDPDTWATRLAAEQRWKKMANGHAGGIGIVLGDLGNGAHLLGLDLDDCIAKDKTLAEHADEIIERFDTYCEVSPSGRGVKLFFMVADEDIAAVHRLLDGKTRLSFPAGEHREIAIDAARFYAITERHLKGTPRTFRTVAVEDVRWLIRQAGPAFQAANGKDKSTTERTTKGTRDESGSGHGFRFMRDCKAEGMDYEAACNTILADAGKAGEWARRSDERQLQRAWDNATVDEDAGAGAGKKQPDQLIALAEDGAVLYHAPDMTLFADIDANGTRQTWRLQDRGFKNWLGLAYYRKYKGAPSSEALRSAMAVISAKAQYDGETQQVCTRVGAQDGKFYLDLCNDRWQAVEIDASGWRIVDAPPIRFRRSANMLPLPMPVRGGHIDELKPFLNVKRDSDFLLVVASVLAALRPHGPYVVLVLLGEAGAAKTSATERLLALVDPQKAEARTLPKEEQDLFIAASNAHMLAYDNVSYLRDWLSDAFCRISTGAGWAARRLYTDDEEVILNVTRPILINGISSFVTRGDLTQRSLPVLLEVIADDKRREREQVLAEFETARPRILGALLDMMVYGMKHFPSTRPERLPRMADFARWGAACEGLVWKTGEFMNAYRSNIAEATATYIEIDLVGTAIREMQTSVEREWTGTAKEFLALLSMKAGEKTTQLKEWPQTPEAMRNALARVAGHLRSVGIDIKLPRKRSTGGKRLIEIRWAARQR